MGTLWYWRDGHGRQQRSSLNSSFLFSAERICLLCGLLQTLQVTVVFLSILLRHRQCIFLFPLFYFYIYFLIFSPFSLNHKQMLLCRNPSRNTGSEILTPAPLALITKPCLKPIKIPLPFPFWCSVFNLLGRTNQCPELFSCDWLIYYLL